MTAPGTKKKYYGKIAKVGIVWGMLRVGTNTLLLLPTTMILARLLTPTEFGVWAAASFFMQLASRLTQLGLAVSLVRIKDLRQEHVSSVFVLSIALGLAAWATVTLSAPYLGSFLDSPDTARVLPVCALGFIILTIGSVPAALLTRDMRWKASATSDWLGTVLNAVVSIALAYRGFSYWSLVYGQLANQLAMAVTRMWMSRWRPSFRFSRSAMGEVLSFGVGMYFKNLFEYAAQNLDSLVVGRLLGVTALGFYDKAFNLTTKVVNNINFAGPGVSFRVFAAIHEDPERFRRAYRRVILSVTIMGYPAFTAMIVVAPELIEALLGAKWLPAVLPFRILCVASALKLLNMYASSATQAKGMIWSEVKRQAAFAVLLVVSVAALSRFGIAGAAVGVLISMLGMTVLMQTLVKRLAHLRWTDVLVPQGPALLCAALVVLTLVLTRVALDTSMPRADVWTGLIVSTIAGAVCYFAFVLFAPIDDLRAVVQETLQDLAPSLAKRMPARIVAQAAGTAD